jgi:hypothetical protein
VSDGEFSAIPSARWEAVADQLTDGWRLTADELAALRRRSVTQNAVVINHVLRAFWRGETLTGDHPDLNPMWYRERIRPALETVRALDAAMTRAPALDCPSLFCRGDHLPVSLWRMIAAGLVTEIRDASFLAASFDPAVAASYRTDFDSPLRRRGGQTRAVLLELEVPQDIPVAYVDKLAAWPSPIHEVLLGRGAAVIIRRADFDGDQLRVRGRVRGFVTPPQLASVLARADVEFEAARRQRVIGIS